MSIRILKVKIFFCCKLLYFYSASVVSSCFIPLTRDTSTFWTLCKEMQSGIRDIQKSTA